MNVFDLSASLSLDTSAYLSALNSAKAGGEGFAAGFNGIVHTIGNAMSRLTGNITGFAKRFVSDSLATGMSFDKAMSQVAATMGKTNAEIDAEVIRTKDFTGTLRDFAQQMGATTAFTSTQAAEALNFMALAGYDAQKSIEMLPTVLNLAAAGNMDLARASDMVTDAASALGLTTEETTAQIDKMAVTSSKSNTSVEQLGEAILAVGGTAKLLTGGTTELDAALGILADNGIKGAEGGLKLRNMLLSLTNPTDKAMKHFKRLGIQVEDTTTGELRPLMDIFADLDSALEGMSVTEKEGILGEIFNRADLAAVEAYLATAKSRWDELTGYIDDSEGAAERMAATQLDNLAGDRTLLESALDGLRLAVSEKMTEPLREMVQTATEEVGKVQKAFEDKGLAEAIRVAGEGVNNVISVLKQEFQKSDVPFLNVLADGLSLIQKAIEYLTDTKHAEEVESFFTILFGFMIASKIQPFVSQFGSLGTYITLAAIMLPTVVKWMGDLTEAISGASENRLKTQLEEIQETAHDAIIEADAQAKMAEGLISSIEEIQQKERITDEDRANWQEYTRQLVEMYPDLNKYVKEETGLLEGNTKEIRNQINALRDQQKERIMMKALEEQQELLSEKALNAEKARLNASAERAKVRGFVADFQLVQGQVNPELNPDLAGFDFTNLEQNIDDYRNAVTNLLNFAWDNGWFGGVGGEDLAENATEQERALNQAALNIGEMGDKWEEALNQAKKYDEEAEKAQKQYENALDSYAAYEQAVNESLSNLMRTTEEATTEAGKLKDEVDSIPEKKTVTIEVLRSEIEDGTAKSTTETGNTEGYHAAGLSYVPNNGYKAELHKGEAILAANTAEDYRSGTNTPDMAGFANMVVGAILQAMSGVQVVMNGERVGDVVTERVSQNIYDRARDLRYA